MNPLRHQFIHEVEVVVEIILGLFRIRNITGITNNSLDHTAGPLRSIDTKFHLWEISRVLGLRRHAYCTYIIWLKCQQYALVDPITPTNIIQSIENTEDVESIVDRLPREIIDCVISEEKIKSVALLNQYPRCRSRIAGITNSIGTTNQSLEGNARNKFPKGSLHVK